MANKKTKNSKKNSKKQVAVMSNNTKIVPIIVAIVAVVVVLVTLISCNKKNDLGKLQGKVKQEEKEEIKPKEETNKLDDVVYYEKINNVTPARMSYEVLNSSTVSETDTEAPVITLNGDEEMYLEYMEDDYLEEGATYTDNKDGNGTITTPTRITLNGNKVDSIDKENMGTYLVFYVYKDAAGNVGSAVRTVVVADTKGPNVVATYERTGNTGTNNNMGQGYSVYTFEVTDPSGVAGVKIALKDENANQDSAWFENNGEELTNNSYTAYANGTYIVYAKDASENANESFTEVEINTVPTRSGNMWTRNVIIGNEGDSFTNIKIYKNQSRFKTNGERRDATEDDFASVPYITHTDGSEGYKEGDNFITITGTTYSGDHWYYFMFDRTSTDENGVTTTEEKVIVQEHCPNGIDDN